MGADAVINHQHHLNEEFVKIGVKGVDYVYSTNEITKKRFDEIVEILNPFGKLVTILPINDHLDLCKLRNKGITVSFECMFTRAAFGIEMEKQGEILRNIASLVDDGTILDITTKVLSFSPESLITAHAIAESGTNIGKLTLDKVHEYFHFAKY
jgi:NADPH:quinone reductase